ncbi:MAG: prepilin-type N-terminal cleavage/methylation domain-containing protein [Synergistaceae bacterium]|nr:prepilin-type N-terminal cleavage/methylation domain-containing protein [Synergistaceae bacterium]
MKKNSKKAFTMAEILVVIAITGIIIVVGIAPLMRTVRALDSVRSSFAADSKEIVVMDRILTDILGVVRINAESPFRIMHDDKLERNADYLILWTNTPAYGFVPMGSVVYGVPEMTVMSSAFETGLYRWVLSGDKQPGVVTKDDLKQEEAYMVIPGVTGVAFNALSGSEWKNNYSGALPRAFRVMFEYGSMDVTYERWLPQF